MLGSAFAATQLASTGFTGVPSPAFRDPWWSDRRRRLVGRFGSCSRGRQKRRLICRGSHIRPVLPVLLQLSSGAPAVACPNPRGSSDQLG